eukprot:TRINITY_DN9986_c0_g2_i2.p2 TRINITY_DN9986_c0_g2~~TRINITY_DN9986_c0_g2_i2.p2  ORF type:complete len:212 (+),score=29.81 TRINITY_DN9986_c0_g2_i2:442-1077(+)
MNVEHDRLNGEIFFWIINIQPLGGEAIFIVIYYSVRQWLEIRGKCPTCRNPLRATEAMGLNYSIQRREQEQDLSKTFPEGFDNGEREITILARERNSLLQEENSNLKIKIADAKKEIEELLKCLQEKNTKIEVLEFKNLKNKSKKATLRAELKLQSDTVKRCQEDLKVQSDLTRKFEMDSRDLERRLRLYTLQKKLSSGGGYGKVCVGERD